MGWPANDIRVDANSAWLAKNPAARALFEAASIPLADISNAPSPASLKGAAPAVGQEPHSLEGIVP